VAVGKDGSLFISQDGAQSAGYSVRRVNPRGIISSFAGTGTNGTFGDGGPATSANIRSVLGLAVGHDGTVYLSDYNRIRAVAPNGIITTVAGKPGLNTTARDFIRSLG
jgi:hypothetical protein